MMEEQGLGGSQGKGRSELRATRCSVALPEGKHQKRGEACNSITESFQVEETPSKPPLLLAPQEGAWQGQGDPAHGIDPSLKSLCELIGRFAHPEAQSRAVRSSPGLGTAGAPARTKFCFSNSGGSWALVNYLKNLKPAISISKSRQEGKAVRTE